MKRSFLVGAAMLMVAGCGAPETPGPDATTYDCTGATKVTTTQIQNDFSVPICVSCHAGDPAYPTDMSTEAKTQALVGLTSPQYGTGPTPLKVVDPNNLQNSTLYLKVLGGGRKFRGPHGELVGGRMPEGLPALTAAQLAEVKNWICTGATN